MAGDVALHRTIWDNDYLNRNPKPFSKREAFIWLICRANHKDNEVLIGDDVFTVKRGSLITSQKKLEKAFNWGNTAVRTYLKQLQKLNMIDYKTTTQATHISISKYCTYQDSQHTDNTKPTRNQHKTNIRPTTNNNVNNVKNVNNKKINTISDLRDAVFVKNYLDKYGEDMLNEFVEHWGETPLNGGKMLCLKQKGFVLGRRISQWAKNDYNGYYKLHKEKLHQMRLDSERQKVIDKAEAEGQIDVDGFNKFKSKTIGNMFDANR